MIDHSAAPRPGLTRRAALTSALVTGAALTSALVTGGALAGGAVLVGCATPEERASDPQAVRLQAAAAQAHADAAAARGLAVLDGGAGPQLRLIAEQRDAHAAALTDELSRYIKKATSVTPTPSSPTTSTSPGNRQALRAQLAKSAADAGNAAVAATGYQAALLGSIAAAVRVHAEVVLG